MLHKFRLFGPAADPAEPCNDGSGKTLDMRWWDWRDILCMGDTVSDLVTHKTVIIEMCTGMMDDRDVEIYEGDIVRAIETWQSYDHIGVVKYSDEHGAYYLTVPDKPEIGRPVMLHEYDCLQVMGNVHDNPEIELSMPFYGDDGHQEDQDAVEDLVTDR